MSTAWDATDRDAFATTLRRTGADESTIAATIASAEQVLDVAGPLRGLRARHVDEAIERAVWRGASGDEQARIRAAGDALLRFVREEPPRRRIRDLVGDGDPAIELAPESRNARRSIRPARTGSLPPLRLDATRGGAPPGKCPGCAGTLRPTGTGTLVRAMQVCAVIAVVLAWWLRARIGAVGVVAVAAALTSLAAGLGAPLAAHACERGHRRVRTE